MKVLNFRGLALVVLAAICLLGTQTSNAGTVTLVNTFLDVTDYSPTGLDLGKEGFIFFNWNNTAGNAGAFQNLNNQLPAWMTFQQTQGASDSGVGGLTYTSGGLATITPPVGPAAASGSLNDPEANNNSNNTIRQFTMISGPSRPGSYLLSVVVDNTAGLHNPDSKLRARLDQGGSFNASPGAAGFNGIPDVYQFRMDTVSVIDFLKIQLRSTDGNDPGIAGFMIDNVPEPTSAALLVLGCVGFISRRRRR